MGCTDPVINSLKQFGYLAVRLPRRDLWPLDVMARTHKDLRRLGPLHDVMVPGNQPLPDVARDIPAANISGQRTSELKLGLGISVLGNFIGAMGGNKIGLDTAFSRAKTLSFEFSDVFEDRIDVTRLDQFLTAGDINPASKYVGDLLEADDVYLLTAVLRSNRFVVEAKQSSAASLEVSVPVIKGIVGGNVNVSHQQGSQSKVVFEGPERLVFGCQAARLRFKDGGFIGLDFATGNIALAQVGGSTQPMLLESAAPFLALQG